MASALLIAAAIHAAIGFGVWEAKFQPHYEPADARTIEAHLVQPPPPPPPPPEPPPKREVHRTPRPVRPHRAPPRPMLRPRPAPALANTAPPFVLPITPAPSPAKAPAAPVLEAAQPKPPPKSPEQHVITNPDWLRQPNGDDLARYYPEEAQRQGISGQATIDCAVSEAGGLVDCSVAAESPKASGFGGAALKMASAFRMRPMTRDGVPVAGGRIRIPIRFVMPDEA